MLLITSLTQNYYISGRIRIPPNYHSFPSPAILLTATPFPSLPPSFHQLTFTQVTLDAVSSTRDTAVMEKENALLILQSIEGGRQQASN